MQGGVLCHDACRKPFHRVLKSGLSKSFAGFRWSCFCGLHLFFGPHRASQCLYHSSPSWQTSTSARQVLSPAEMHEIKLVAMSVLVLQYIIRMLCTVCKFVSTELPQKHCMQKYAAWLIYPRIQCTLPCVSNKMMDSNRDYDSLFDLTAKKNKKYIFKHGIKNAKHFLKWNSVLIKFFLLDQ